MRRSLSPPAVVAIVGGAIVGCILAAVGDAVLGLSWVQSIAALGMAGFGTVVWYLGGSTLLAALSWTLPLLLWEIAKISVAWPWSLVGSLLGVGFLVAMVGMVRTSLPRFWYRRVLRQSPPAG